MSQTVSAFKGADGRYLRTLVLAGALLWLLVLPARLVQLEADRGSPWLTGLTALAALLLLVGFISARDQFFQGLAPVSHAGFTLVMLGVLLVPFSSFFISFVVGALVLGALMLCVGMAWDAASRPTALLILGSLVLSLCVGALGAAVSSSAFLPWAVGAVAVAIPLALVPPALSSRAAAG